MATVLYNLFGKYTPITYTYVIKVWDAANEQFETVTNTIIAEGMAGVNWEWIAGVFLFGIFFMSIMRIIGGLICGKL